jgi:hypothetical protein
MISVKIKWFTSIITEVADEIFSFSSLDEFLYSYPFSPQGSK